MQIKNNPLIGKIRFYSNFVMIALYFLMGVLFLFSDFAVQLLPDHRKGFAGVLILYAVYRFYTAYNIYKKE